MLRTKYIQKIRSALAQSRHFHAEEFEIAQEPKEWFTLLEIRYRALPNFYFKAHIPYRCLLPIPDASSKITLQISPGLVVETDKREIAKADLLYEEIHQWTQRLYEDLMDIPMNKLIREQQEEIESILLKLKDIPDEYFSQQEATEMEAKLDVLEETLLQKLQALIEDQEELKKCQASLHDEVQQLKDTIEILKKPGWHHSFVAKITGWLKSPENKKILKESAVDVGKQILIEATKNQLGI